MPSMAKPPRTPKLASNRQRTALERRTGWTPVETADPRPVERQIYDSRDATVADESGFGSGAYGAGSYGGLNSGPLNSEPLNEMPAPLAEQIMAERAKDDRSRAPEAVRDFIPAGFQENPENNALMAFLSELDFSGGRVIPKALFVKHGIHVQPDFAEDASLDAAQ